MTCPWSPHCTVAKKTQDTISWATALKSSKQTYYDDASNAVHSVGLNVQCTEY